MRESTQRSRFFELLPGDAGWIDGRHAWFLPNRIGCPECGVYGAVGASHPAADLSTYPDADTLRTPRGVSWRQFTEIRASLAEFLGPRFTIGPGDALGPFAGKAKGKSADFIGGDVGLLFASVSAMERLRSAGISISTAPASLRKQPSGWPALVELDLPRAGRFDDSAYRTLGPRCSTCGRREGWLERNVLATDSVVGAPDAFRPVEHAPIILVSERFRIAASELGLSGVTFAEVEITTVNSRDDR